MALATAPDLRTQYGPVMDLEEFAAYLGTTVRALRPALRRVGVVTISVGDSERVQVAVATAALGLERLDVLEDQADLEARRRLLTHRPDGAPRPLDEFWAVVESQAPAAR